MSDAEEAPSVVKRQRTDAIGSAVGVSGPVEHLPVIRSLSAQTVCNILAHAAQQHPDVAASIVNERHKIIAAEKAKIIDFDFYSKLTWKALNANCAPLSSSQQYDTFVAAEVLSYVNTIAKATKKHSSFGTKKSALETLRKIGKSICLSADTLGREVRSCFHYENILEKTMLRIARSMTVEEQNAVMTVEFEDKLVQLEKLSTGYSLFETLKDVRLALLGSQETADVVEVEEVEDEDEDDMDDAQWDQW